MPNGIETVIGEKRRNGLYEGGGKGQKEFPIARAILKDAPIILMDEATAIFR